MKMSNFACLVPLPSLALSACCVLLVACAQPAETTSALTDDEFESDSEEPTTTTGAPQTTTEIPTAGPSETETDTNTDTDSLSETETDTDSDSDTTDTETDSETSETSNSATDTDPGSCGDGEVNGDEVCDDGVNDNSYGGCAEDCSALAPYCGDANVDVDDGEICDDGVNDNAYDGCSEDCTAFAAYCGDANVDVDDGEVCDDGINDDAYGGCAEDCTALGPHCGDGFLDDWFGEVCDDGLNDGGYGSCTPDCSAKGPHCGDGELQADEGEECDGMVLQTCPDLLFFGGELTCDPDSCTVANECTGFLDTFEITQSFAEHWTVGGDVEFFASDTMEVNDMWAGENGNISHNQSSSAELTLQFDADGEIAFVHRESTEATFDELRFFIDDVATGEWSGINPAADVSFPVSAGLHTFRWVYEKDGSVSAGSDRVWIDDVRSEVGYRP